MKRENNINFANFFATKATLPQDWSYNKAGNAVLTQIQLSTKNEEPRTQACVNFSYDAFNRRVKKVVNATPTAAQSTTYYLYSSEGLMAEYTQTGQEIRSYGWKPNSTWGTDPVFLTTKNQEQGTTNFAFYVNDTLATPQRLINSSGDVVWSASYNTFGKGSVSA